VKDGRVECREKGNVDGPVLQKFYTSPVPLAPEMTEAEEEQARMLEVSIEHGIVYLNNKPGDVKTFKYQVNDTVVSFQNTTGRELFSLRKEYVVVDPASKLSEDSVGSELLTHRNSSTKQGIASNVLIENHATQCIMLFGTSGSGKTTNAGNIIKQFIQIQKETQKSAPVVKLESVKVLYGQAEMKGKGNTRKLIFHDVGIHDFNLKRFNTALRSENFTKNALGNVGVIPLVQETLQTMQRAAFKVDKLPKRKYVNLVSQTTNTVSSRCLVAYTIRVGIKTLILFDAPGNENAADIIHSMFRVLDSNINDDELVDLILSSNLSHEKGNLQGSLPVKGIAQPGTEVLAYHDATDPVQQHMKGEVEKHRRKGNVGGPRHNPDAYIPGMEKELTDALKPEHLEYCQERVRESLYINLLVGKMTETLDMSKANDTGVMKQVSPFMTVGVGNKTKTGTTFENPTLFCQGGQCTVQETRALYPAHDTASGNNTTALTDDEMHQHHMKLKTNQKNRLLEEVLPIRALQQECAFNAIRAVIVLPIRSANNEQRDIVQKGVKLMSLQLIGKPSDQSTKQ
tara:strand:- start:219 stop:1928 length:1710 start_codon:yes stop_codon:yes gene_type:complete